MVNTNALLPVFRIRKDFFIGLIFFAYGLLMIRCKPKEQLTDSATVSGADSTVATEERVTVLMNNIIQYHGVTQDEVKTMLETFAPWAEVQSLARVSIQIKDSLEAIRDTQQLTDPNDSLIFMPAETKAYQAIMAYQKFMAAGPSRQGNCPDLLQLNRTPEPEDSSFMILPKNVESKFLSHGKFFFLGGAPFIAKLQTDDNTVYSDLQGNPETRFASSITENGNFLLNSIYHFKSIPTRITFGPPLESYDSGPQDVNGIGSLIHTPETRIPVFFLTETGVVNGYLVSVTVKLVPEALGCVSDQPLIEFACSQQLEAEQILGVYIAYKAAPISSCTITRHNNAVWTADINGDGVADIACVSGTFEGISSDTMAEVLWYANINGTWKIIDWGQDLDCT